MQILEIVLYSKQGEKRTLNLNPGKVNVITGDSMTGKSALTSIIDYCLGSSKCNVPVGRIRDTVAWFGLRLQFKSEQMFIARQNPKLGQQTATEMFYLQGDIVDSPKENPPASNTTHDAMKELIARKIGVSPSKNTPPEGQTRDPLVVTLRHALIYCFQEQGEITDKKFLFHNQGEERVPQAIKDTIPYFLGAVKEDRMILEQQLRSAKRDLKMAQRKLNEQEAIRGDSASKSVALIAEAQSAGLIENNVQSSDLSSTVNILRVLLSWVPEQLSFPGSERTTQIQQEIRDLKEAIYRVSDQIEAAKIFAQQRTGFEVEAQEQTFRLESINLYPDTSKGEHTCPLCSQETSGKIPTISDIRQSLEGMRSNLQFTTKDNPKLLEYTEQFQEEFSSLKQQIQQKNEELNGIYEAIDSAKQLRDLNVSRGKVIGRVSLWLESVNMVDESSALKDKVKDAEKIVLELEKKLDKGVQNDRLNSVLNRINSQMTTWSETLQLEHSGNPMRLDLSKLTVFIDRSDNPIPLSQMGSGKNWLGIHLITYLSLQKHFQEAGRPVPAFTFFDQPTQVFYPPEKELSEEEKTTLSAIKDEDRRSVDDMFNFIFDIVEKLEGKLQIIITDHADLTSNSRFQDAIVESWRGGQALIPKEWS